MNVIVLYAILPSVLILNVILLNAVLLTIIFLSVILIRILMSVIVLAPIHFLIQMYEMIKIYRNKLGRCCKVHNKLAY
jgi:hypothetical protein